MFDWTYDMRDFRRVEMPWQLMFVICGGGVFAEERVVIPNVLVKAAVLAADVDVVAGDVEEQVEPLNLNVLAAPLQALFGIGMAGPVAVEMAPADAVAQNEAMVQQFVQQFRPYLTEELNFVRLVCSDLSSEQRPKIKGAGEAALKQAAKEMAEFQNGQNRAAGLPIAQPRTMPEPRKLVREAMTKSLMETLTEEQLGRYKVEAETRVAQRKKAAILSVVSRLDGSLFLSQDQRTKIIDEISSNWQEKWEQWLMLSAYGPEYFPVLPDQYVTPHLDANQKTVYRDLQKIDFGVWWGGGMQNQQNDGWWGDEPEKAEAGLNGVIFNFQVGF